MIRIARQEKGQAIKRIECSIRRLSIYRPERSNRLPESVTRCST
ncbi:MAG: hypothetical protein RL346_235 [Verrucomicrobiota bacterium]